MYTIGPINYAPRNRRGVPKPDWWCVHIHVLFGTHSQAFGLTLGVKAHMCFFEQI